MPFGGRRSARTLNMGSIKLSFTVLVFLALAVLNRAQVAITDLTDEDIKGWRGNSLLAQAIKKGNLDDVKLLVERGANINYKDSYGYSHLHKAASKGQLEIVKYLHSQGADILTHDNGLTTPLWLAAYNGDLPMVEYLADSGAPLDTPRAWLGLFPLNAAVEKGRVEVVRFLIERGADVDKKCEAFGSRYNKAMSSLEIARKNLPGPWGRINPEYEEIIKLLVDAGAKETQ